MYLIWRAAVFGLQILLASAPSAYAAEVVVRDGDSLLYNGIPLEIWGVIAPEKSETCRTSQGRDWPCGQRAFDELSAAAADETFQCVEKEPGFATCRAGGLDVGQLLVKSGLVRARQGYRDVELRAKEARLGLWE